MFYGVLVGKNSGLEKYIHSLSDFNNDVVLVNKRGSIVLFHDVGGGVLDRDVHVFIVVERCYKIKIEIGSHK